MIAKLREAVAMVATARWMYNSGLQRQETRVFIRDELVKFCTYGYLQKIIR